MSRPAAAVSATANGFATRRLGDRFAAMAESVVACRCPSIAELDGEEAEEYVTGHLRRDERRTERFEELYACPDTGRRWVLDYPDRTESDSGQARLRST